jgi:hypothetical protein
VTTIGRTAENDIVLAEVGVSRVHAHIVEGDGRYYLEDLASANGTLLNGVPIAGRRELSTGDSVAVGPVVLAFSTLSVDDLKAAAARAPARPLRPALGPPPVPTRERTRTEESMVVFDDSSPSGLVAKATGPAVPAVPAAPAAPPPPAAPAAPAVPSTASGRFSALLEAAAAPKGQPAPVAQQDTRFISRPVLTDLPRPPVRTAELDQQETRLKVPIYGEGDEEVTHVPTDGGSLSVPRPTISLPVGIEDPGPDVGTVSEVAPVPVAPSAADRARKRRQAGQSLGGQLGYYWSEMSPRAKGVVAALLLAIVGGTGGSLWLVFGPADGPRLGAEGSRLGPEPLTQSFGLGDQVQFERPDMKIFQFEFAVPTQAVAILHYQASDISQDEVAIIVNGVEQGTVPPDTSVADRELEQVLSPKTLKRNATNQVTFDNLKNPPGHETWRIANPWVEVIPVPDLPAPELLVRANEFARRGKEFLDLRDVGSDNLFKAWKSYRQAWITLVALPDDARPELFLFVADQRATLGRELDQKCRTLMLDAKRSMQLKNPEKALEALEDVARYFPTTEHRCHNLALQTMNEYEL